MKLKTAPFFGIVSLFLHRSIQTEKSCKFYFHLQLIKQNVQIFKKNLYNFILIGFVQNRNAVVTDRKMSQMF